MHFIPFITFFYFVLEIIKKFSIVIARAFPAIIIAVTLINVFVNYNRSSVMLAILVLFSEFTTPFLKEFLFKGLMGDKTYPILGSGLRPKGAMNCGIIANGKKATSYGMPSGHSQVTTAFVTYIILTILCSDNSTTESTASIHPSCLPFAHYSSKNIFPPLPFTFPPELEFMTNKYFISTILVLIALLIMYSRVYLGCHTIQQTVIGSLIGAIYAVLLKYYEPLIVEYTKQ